MTTLNEAATHQIYPDGPKRQWWYLIIAVVAVLIAIAAIVYGLGQRSNSAVAQSQSTSLSKQIALVQAQDSRLQAEINAAQATANQAKQAASGANLAHLGVCWSATYQTQNSTTWVSGLSVDQAIDNSGVYTCPQGDTFTSVVPGTPTNGG